MSSESNKKWVRSSAIWQVILILVLFYTVSSINVLILAAGILPYLQGAYFRTYVLRYFSEISFAIVIFLGIFHVSMMIKKKKEDTDRAEV